MKAEELIPEGLRLEGFHTAHYDFSFEELCAVLPDDFAARLKTFIHAKYELFLKGAEGDEKAWCMGKLNKDTYATIMRGERPEDLYSFHSFWSMPDIKWHLRFMMDMTKEMKLALKDIIDHEDKKHPLSDIALQREMKARGYDLARRTIAKYRDQMGIPKAILRKE